MQEDHKVEQLHKEQPEPGLTRPEGLPDLPVYGGRTAASSGSAGEGASAASAGGAGEGAAAASAGGAGEGTSAGSAGGAGEGTSAGPAGGAGEGADADTQNPVPAEASADTGAASAQGPEKVTGNVSSAGAPGTSEDDWTDISDRIIQQSAKEIRDDTPTEEELRRRQKMSEQRRTRIAQARQREEKRYRRTRVEMKVIIGILAAAIALCGVLIVILVREPELVVTIRENLPTWEKIVETVTETAEEVTETADNEPEEAVEVEEETLDGVVYEGTFELPIEGATGYAPVAISVTDDDGSKVGSLSAGEAFVILDVDGDDCYIEMSDGTTGRISASCTWVNLPDIIPSIIYYDVNADSSIFKSSGYNLPGITGEQLYTSRYMNERLGEEEYCMPVLYSMAVKIMQVQQQCLANGESLKIYQTFRPYETQMAVANALQSLESSNSEVYAGLNSGSWSDTWFIATKLSNHQRGCAIDVTLVQVDATEQRLCAGYLYTVVSEYTEYAMPSDMHELSYRAAVFDPPVSSSSETAWRSAQYTDTMTTYAYKLQDYCTTNGLSPLSSEWWHFNDLEAKSAAGSNIGTGNFYLTECLSREPAAAGEDSEDLEQE